MSTLLLSTVLMAAGELTTATVLPFAVQELHGIALYGLAFSVSSLVDMAATVLAGDLTDRQGPRRPFAIGVTLFCLGVVIVLTAPGMTVLVIGRCVMGAGKGLFAGAAFAAQTISIPAQLRSRVLAITLTLWLPTAIIVPQAAALLERTWSWRIAYLPLIILAAGILGFRIYSLDGQAQRKVSDGHLAEGIRVAFGSGLLIVGINNPNPLLFASGLLTGAVLVTAPLRRLLPAGTFRAAPGLPALILTRALFGFGVLALESFESLALTTVRSEPGWVLGVMMACGSLGVSTGGWIRHRYCRRISAVHLLRIGAAISILGVGGFCVSVFTPIPVAIPLIFVVVRHLGWGIVVTGTAEALMALAPRRQEGKVTAAGETLLKLGFGLAPGIGGVFVATAVRQGMGAGSGIAAAGALSAVALTAAFLLFPRIQRDTVR